MDFEVLFFDLDETLYPAGNGVWDAIAERINLYIHQRLNLPWKEIPALREQYYLTYGTTMRGLEEAHHIDTQEYLRFVHDIPITDYLQPNEPLREMLINFPQSKYIFTNADSNHAKRVLQALAIEDCFEGVIDVNMVSPYCKPQPEAYETVLKLLDDIGHKKAVLIDDKIANLKTANRFDFFTVLVGQSDSVEGVDACISNILDLPGVLKDKG